MIRLAGMCVVAMVMAVAEAPAQSPEPRPRIEREVNVRIVHGPEQAGAPALLPPIDGDLDFVTMPLAIGGDTVTGAPYSADAVTEVVQTLADGNRIVRQSSASVYRDAAGRTRREQGLAVIGNVVGGGDHRTQVQIHDPQSGAMYLLDTDIRTAHRLHAPKVSFSAAAFTLPVPPPADGAGAVFFRRRTVTAAVAAPPATVEQLGTRTIEGVEAEGTRSTSTIPAGQIGNEQPIAIVSERWFSLDLKALVMSRQSDPRFGETTYRLTNITRAEPSPDLFQVPADYRVVEDPATPATEKK